MASLYPRSKSANRRHHGCTGASHCVRTSLPSSRTTRPHSKSRLRIDRSYDFNTKQRETPQCSHTGQAQPPPHMTLPAYHSTSATWHGPPCGQDLLPPSVPSGPCHLLSLPSPISHCSAEVLMSPHHPMGWSWHGGIGRWSPLEGRPDGRLYVIRMPFKVTDEPQLPLPLLLSSGEVSNSLYSTHSAMMWSPLRRATRASLSLRPQ